MYYTGFADEAGASLDMQIKATKALGWSCLESRNIDGVNVTDISDEKFDEVCQKLADAGITINCFGSAIANWSRDPRKDEDFEYSVAALQRAIPRMQTLGTTMLRGMSFVVVQDVEPDSPELEKIIFEKVNHIVKLCEDGGVFYMHENCMNYGGMSHEYILKLLNNVKSPNFKLVFDTANPVFTDRRIGPKPYRKQSSWEFYANVKEFVEYVHIKDARYIAETDDIFPKTEHVFPGDGDGDVVKIVTDLLHNGYNGGFPIEPHLAVVFHDDSVQSADDVRYNNYIEYGRRFMQLVANIHGIASDS